MKFIKSIKFQLMLYGGGLIIIICLGLGLVEYINTSITLTDEVEERLIEKAGDIGDLVKSRLDTKFATLESIANRRIIKSMEWKKIKPIIEREIKRSGYATIALVKPNGITYYIDDSKLQLGDRDYIKEAFNGNTNISDMLISRVINEPVVMLATPIINEEEVVGVLIARILGKDIISIVTDVSFGERGYAYMVNDEGIVIAHRNGKLVMEQFNPIEKAKSDDKLVSLANITERMIDFKSGFGKYYFNGSNLYLGYDHIEGTDWSIGVTAPVEQVLESLYSLRLIIITVALLFLGVALIGVYIISSKFSKPIELVVKQCQLIASGNFTDVLGNKFSMRRDEIGRLISGLKYMMNRISKLTYNDPLTGLPNMIFLRNNLNSDLNSITDIEDNIYLFTVGFKNFSLINSNYGYQIGNKLLSKASKRLNELVQREVIVVRNNNEFIFYFKSQEGKEEILKLGKMILNKLSNPYNIEEKLIYSEINMGIVFCGDKELEFEELIKRSKLAMHFTEKNNINILFYDEKMRNELSDRIDLESKLRNAIKNKEFILNYQPLLNAKEEEVIGLEALIRWKHPKDGIISPGKFIPLAEDTGMIVKIGDWVLKKSCLKLKKWHQDGYNNLIMSVNIAPQQFQKDDFVEKVETILEEMKLDPKYLKLEITERTVIENVNYTIKTLNKLKELGVKIAIDDFGTGYSSLEYLNKFSFDMLKIDRAFIHDNSNEGIVKTIIMMGKILKLDVIAEGVETEEELNFLLKNNCHLCQGYFFSKPLGEEGIDKLLRDVFDI